ncbi:cadmium-translocating P-type ATPase [Bacillus sp. AGMB 02131]|uniref:Cadmium-translocating P-type ATPase n=1 Tax=Peribacillus faecalis TaxID=2772559 RepID=A0A927HAJ0_9BACI|nr:heavy metal translocating P-type ATPase [Peribacillus faecalis]MBD3107979.1 cadmium-translocating P-type ATPase [Peribacillus faecalis]
MDASVGVLRNRWEKLREHAELIAALLSGVLILVAWLLSENKIETWSIITFLFAFAIGGYAKAKEGILATIEDKKLNVEILMLLAAVGSAVIGYWTEGAILIFIFALSGALETYTMNKSHREISALMDLQPEEAVKIDDDGKETVVSVADLQIGDIVLIKAGERVPSDGMIVKGSTNIDESAITGEPIPVIKQIEDEVFAGTVNLRGTITVKITKGQEETLFQKIIELVQSAQSEKSPSQLFIEKFEGAYVNGVLIFVAIMMFLPHYTLGWSWNETIYRAMVLLVVASPCALAASIMPATLSAISNGARRGILFKGGIHLENLGNLKAIALDKTGTLTKGKPEVTDVIFRDDLTEEVFLQHVASVEKYSNHPLAQSIVKYAAEHTELPLISPDSSEDISGNGAQAILDGKQWKVGKKDFVGAEEAVQFQDGIALKLAAEGKTTVFVRDEKGIAGLITLKDMVRPETIAAIEKLKSVGVHTFMLTGDGKATAEAIAAESHIDGFVAECLPETKVEEIKKLKEKYGTVAMVGDGINDAPALATASIGIAMGEGTDVALETADVVLMKNNLSLIAEAVVLSRKMNKIIKQNIIFSIAVIMLLICSNFLQFISLPYGVIGHEGSTILVILNGLRLLQAIRMEKNL